MKNIDAWPGVVTQSFNSSLWEVEVDRPQGVQDQTGLYNYFHASQGNTGRHCQKHKENINAYFKDAVMVGSQCLALGIVGG